MLWVPAGVPRVPRRSPVLPSVFINDFLALPGARRKRPWRSLAFSRARQRSLALPDGASEFLGILQQNVIQWISFLFVWGGIN